MRCFEVQRNTLSSFSTQNQRFCYFLLYTKHKLALIATRTKRIVHNLFNANNKSYFVKAAAFYVSSYLELTFDCIRYSMAGKEKRNCAFSHARVIYSKQQNSVK